MTDRVHYLFKLSDPELVRWWELYASYPTHDRRQRARLDAAVARATRENVPKLMNLAELRGVPGDCAEPVERMAKTA